MADDVGEFLGPIPSDEELDTAEAGFREMEGLIAAEQEAWVMSAAAQVLRIFRGEDDAIQLLAPEPSDSGQAPDAMPNVRHTVAVALGEQVITQEVEDNLAEYLAHGLFADTKTSAVVKAVFIAGVAAARDGLVDPEQFPQFPADYTLPDTASGPDLA